MKYKGDTHSVAISLKSKKILRQILKENPKLEKILRETESPAEVTARIREWVMNWMEDHPAALKFYSGRENPRSIFEELQWDEIAAIRILDYLDHAGTVIPDLNQHGKEIENDPFRLMMLAYRKGTGGAKPAFFLDMLHLFRQFNGKKVREIPHREKVKEWMERYPSGLDPEIIKLREQNRDRILNIIIDRMEKGLVSDHKYVFPPNINRREKLNIARKWWNERLFHLRFAVRSPRLLQEMLGGTLEPETMEILEKAREAGIPTFVNPYYLSLLLVNEPFKYQGIDQAIRDYVIYSRELVDEFGEIVAWEKEDVVEPGIPNTAGFILPSRHNVHRRYPEVAILIPDTMGRACGGLCSSCQRMYDFQRGHLNFNLDELKPEEKWPIRLIRLMEYFRNDSQLRDILITGGDALMSTDKSLEKILDAVYEMARAKKKDNLSRKEGEKYAEMIRIRLGTRLPIYLPQRISPELVSLLKAFREKAMKIGIRQFVIQTHFESPLEITPESKLAVERLLSAGWIVTNQLVFTAAASRRGHTARLRQALNDIGVLAYYTFTVKGYMENSHNFATNSRAVQEQVEEKSLGVLQGEQEEWLDELNETENIRRSVDRIREQAGIPFLATDRNVLNLPGVGKSLTFRTIGITRHGRRILSFDHDHSRWHSPIIKKMGKVTIIESKPIARYLEQLEDMGEDPEEYRNIWGYSLGVTENRASVFNYPEYEFPVTGELTNLKIE
ncbi:MAG TPA: KamA family protein [Bacteroidetes bacterium]|nr:KamA family protein [Bacteroidota bacterium]